MKPKILYVDDERLALANFAEFFEEDWTIKTFDNPILALAAIKAFQPAIILADQKMPEMDGLEFLKQAIPLAPHARRLVLTAAPSNETGHTELVEARVDKYIAKPKPNTELEPILKEIYQHYLEAETDRREIEELKRNYNDLVARYDTLRALSDSKDAEISELRKRK